MDHAWTKRMCNNYFKVKQNKIFLKKSMTNLNSKIKLGILGIALPTNLKWTEYHVENIGTEKLKEKQINVNAQHYIY